MALVAVFLLMGRFSHLMNLNRCHAGKSSSKNWKTSICCNRKPLLNFIESYESPDGKNAALLEDATLFFLIVQLSPKVSRIILSLVLMMFPNNLPQS